MNLGIVIARAGSKRIKHKNLKKFLGKPIIFYTLKISIETRLFDKIIVSTDSEELKNLIRKNFPNIEIHDRKKNFLMIMLKQSLLLKM